MEFKTKAALTEWANDQTMAEIAAYYNGLPSMKSVKKFESRDVAVTRIWAVLSPDRPKVARGARKKATSGRKQPKTSKRTKASNTVRDQAVKLLSRAGGATLEELMKAFKWQAHSVRGFMSVLGSKHGFKIESAKVNGVRAYRIK
jgi:hypothetical protein